MLARAAGTPSYEYNFPFLGIFLVLIACCIAGDIYFFLAPALAWGGAAMHLRCHCFWRFSRPAPLLGRHIITEFVLVLFLSIKAAMDLLSIAILLQLMCLFLLPSKQSSGKSSIYGFCFGRREEGINKIFARK